MNFEAANQLTIKFKIMRTILFSGLALFLMAGCGEHISTSKVPNPAVESFQSKFPSASNVKWGKENETTYEAEFKMNGQSMSATFDANGSWQETETTIEMKDVPEPVKNFIHTNYAGYSIRESEHVETASNGLLYELEIKKGDETLEIKLTPDGTFLGKSEEDED